MTKYVLMRKDGAFLGRRGTTVHLAWARVFHSEAEALAVRKVRHLGGLAWSILDLIQARALDTLRHL